MKRPQLSLLILGAVLDYASVAGATTITLDMNLICSTQMLRESIAPLEAHPSVGPQ